MLAAANAYARISRSALTPREAEAAVLLKAAGRLQAVRGTAAGPALNEALVFNQRVWTILATAATEPEAPLPDDLRAGLARLAAFVFGTILDTMIQPDPAKLDALISLNHHLAAGLQGDPGPGA